MSLRLHVGCFSLFPWGRERESHRILSDRFSVSLPISLITKPSPFLVAKPERNFFRLLTGRCTLRWKCLTVAAAIDLDLISVQLRSAAERTRKFGRGTITLTGK